MKSNFKVIFVFMIILLILYMYYGIENAHKKNDEENFKILSDAIVRSAVHCYAIEGFYPPNIKYLEDNYGLIVDHDKYFISYNIFASNIMPEIMVFIK
ncbi:MAG TPA: hypothetical protein GX396_04680 [Tissierellia bacterium]|nr:hypothetical protein [Tissierellia bacterium]